MNFLAAGSKNGEMVRCAEVRNAAPVTYNFPSITLEFNTRREEKLELEMLPKVYTSKVVKQSDAATREVGGGLAAEERRAGRRARERVTRLYESSILANTPLSPISEKPVFEFSSPLTSGRRASPLSFPNPGCLPELQNENTECETRSAFVWLCAVRFRCYVLCDADLRRTDAVCKFFVTLRVVFFNSGVVLSCLRHTLIIISRRDFIPKKEPTLFWVILVN